MNQRVVDAIVERGRSGPVRCAKGRCLLGHLVVIEMTVTVEGDDDIGQVDRVKADIGARLTLAEGFVNMGARHPTGPVWYGRPSRFKETRSQALRPPVVVTCSCALDNLIDTSVDEDARAMATATADERVELADVQLRGEDEDLDTQLGVDRYLEAEREGR